MTYWVMCLVGWIALWFRPEWRWLVVAGLIVALPGPVLAIAYFHNSGFPLANLLRNAAVSFATGFATFAVPAAVVVLVRRKFFSAAKN